MSTNKITFLLNWEAAPYHIPVYLANIKVISKMRILILLSEPSNPSDVTELVGSGKVDMGLKAMVHWPPKLEDSQ